MIKLIEDLNKSGVFVRQLESSDIPYHKQIFGKFCETDD